MPEDDKTKEKASAETKADRRRLTYLKTRTHEIKKEFATNKAEMDALRRKLGMTAKARKTTAGGEDDGDDED